MRTARPWTGLILGMLLGLAVAVLLQQEGVWPLDRLLVFGLVGLFGLLGTWLGRAGRAVANRFSMITPLLLGVLLLVVGAFGAGAASENGELNGPCTVTAQSSVPDETSVTDTSRNDPFRIDPNGTLSWQAQSSPPITDHNWEIYVGFAGFNIPIADGGDPNEGESPGSSDTITDLTAYIQEVTSATGQELRGVFEVGGFIATDGIDVCDGFGFVLLTSDGIFESTVSKVALALALLLLLLLLILFMRRHGGDAGFEEGSGDLSDLGEPDVDGAAAGGAAAAGGMTAAAEQDEVDDEEGGEEDPDAAPPSTDDGVSDDESQG